VPQKLKAKSTPEARAAALMGTGLEFSRIGLEAGPISQWLRAGLKLPDRSRQPRTMARDGHNDASDLGAERLRQPAAGAGAG